MMMLVLKHVASRVKRARTHTLFALSLGGQNLDQKGKKGKKKATPKPKGHERAKKKIKVNGFTHLVVTG
jgi:hypothetical protein